MIWYLFMFIPSLKFSKISIRCGMTIVCMHVSFTWTPWFTGALDGSSINIDLEKIENKHFYIIKIIAIFFFGFVLLRYRWDCAESAYFASEIMHCSIKVVAFQFFYSNHYSYQFLLTLRTKHFKNKRFNQKQTSIFLK